MPVWAILADVNKIMETRLQLIVSRILSAMKPCEGSAEDRGKLSHPGAIRALSSQAETDVRELAERTG
jgi:hypothetical protein